MRYLLALLLLLPFAAVAAPGDPVGNATGSVSWLAPTQNEDGTPATDVVGYNIYSLITTATRPAACKSPPGYRGINFAPACAAYYTQKVSVNGAGVLTAPLTFVLSGPTRIAFAMTAVDAAGNESGYTNEIAKVLTVTITDATPLPPGSFNIQFNGITCSVEGRPELTCTFTSD